LQKCGRGFLYPCLKFKRLPLGITVMFLLIFAFALYSIIYPEIKKNENKYKIIATDMRADLELIMNNLKKAEN